MGYRSEVSLTIKNEDFHTLVEKSQKENSGAYETIKGAKIFRKERYTTLYWDWYKWYGSYPEIAFIESFMFDIPHVFHRLGEDDTDYEYSEDIGADEDENYDMFECVGVLREIDVSGAGEQIFIQAA